jgi:hypothetical protein
MQNAGLKPVAKTTTTGHVQTYWTREDNDEYTRELPTLGLPGDVTYDSIRDYLKDHDRNPRDLQVIDNDMGGMSLYVAKERVEAAIVEDTYNGLSYRLPLDNLVMKQNLSIYDRDRYQSARDSGSFLQLHAVSMDILHRYPGVNESIRSLLKHPATARKLRASFFDPRNFGEERVIDRHGETVGYLYVIHDREEYLLDELHEPRYEDNTAAGSKDSRRKSRQDAAFSRYQELETLDGALRADYIDEVLEFVREYGRPLSGSYRLTFDMGHTVAKFPQNFDGLEHNNEEFMHSNLSENPDFPGVPIANCKLVYTANGMPYLIMEKVDTHIPEDAKMPA